MIDLNIAEGEIRAIERLYRDIPFYAEMMDGSAWDSFQRGISLTNFRGEHNYLAQMTLGATVEQYRNTFDYVRTIDTKGYLERLGEDGLYGALTFEFDGVTVSRDLLDSVLEIYYLRDILGIREANVLTLIDIGAGYGRLTHRFLQVFPGAVAYCLDAVPISTYLCQQYLTERGVYGRAMSVRLDRAHEIDFGSGHRIAANVHSWSEATLASIGFWLELLKRQRVPYLMVIPHDRRWLCVDPGGKYPCFKPLIEAHGYKLMDERDKYPSSVDGIYPNAVYSLWSR